MPQFLATRGYETVIIDEAAQALEPETLLPLSADTRRCALVGDPKQVYTHVCAHAYTHAYAHA